METSISKISATEKSLVQVASELAPLINKNIEQRLKLLDEGKVLDKEREKLIKEFGSASILQLGV